MITLYQFPLSHYCEKARWALKYKKVDHKVVNLLPRFHASKAKKLAPHSSVPILVCDGQVVQGSAEIITFLDNKYPEQSLTPVEIHLREEALEWEKYLDKELGPHVRRCCYHILLEYPEIVINLLAHQSHFYGKPLLKLIFTKLKTRMKKLMNINNKTADASRRRIKIVIDKLYDHLQTHSYLVGNQFTRADLTAAALIAPLRMPEKYGLNWPKKIPGELVELMNEFSGKIEWVDELYENYR